MGESYNFEHIRPVSKHTIGFHSWNYKRHTKLTVRYVSGKTIRKSKKIMISIQGRGL